MSAILVCYVCNKQFKATGKYFKDVVELQIPDSQIQCDLCTAEFYEEFTYDDQLAVFWEEVWS